MARPKRIEDIKRAGELAKKGLSYREISLILFGKENKKQIWRWLKKDKLEVVKAS